MDLALFRLPNGESWLGTGPFAEHEAPPDGSMAFYINDFALSDARPWKVPATAARITNPTQIIEALQGALPPQIQWTMPTTEWFESAFRLIRRDVLSHKLRKMVPVLAEAGKVESGDPASLLRQVLDAPKGLWGYGRVKGGDGFLGATPELLAQVQGARLETMALAGTARPGDLASFTSDAKEIEEHEIVAGFLEQALGGFGPVARSPRHIQEAAGLTHFCTRLSVEISGGKVDLNALVKLLHPTPAVGCLPRDEAALQKLTEYRRQLQAPPFFGAPFGFKSADAFYCVVAIRGLSWSGRDALLPSGCGIVAGSAFDHEWRELQLKRDTVARMLGV